MRQRSEAKPLAPPARERRGTRRTFDEIELFALLLISVGVALAVWGAAGPPGALSQAVGRSAPNWTPGLVVDGMLLWVVNGIIRKHERNRVLSQVGSLSREFALDATRRAREEGWLVDGSMAARALSRASLRGADLSDARFPGADFTFADLRGATLAHADLRGADLTGIDLREADLRWSQLSGAQLRWADLRGALLDGAVLEGADTRFAAIDARHADHPGLAGAIVGGFLNDDQIAEVRRTFELLAAQGLAPVELFYDRLFAAAPEVRALFRSDPAHQARKFLSSLRVIVSALDSPIKHVAMLQSLGERHRGYGVVSGYYPLVRDTLLSVMADQLGPQFTPSAAAAWGRAFELMATIMNGGEAGGRQPTETSSPLRLTPPGPAASGSGRGARAAGAPTP
jgi:hemoglobin-like flavoprotein